MKPPSPLNSIQYIETNISVEEKKLDKKERKKEDKRKGDKNNKEVNREDDTENNKDPKVEKDNNEKKNDTEEKDEYSWRKELVEDERIQWRKELLQKTELESQAKQIISAKERWRANLIAGLTLDETWKGDLVLNCIDKDHGSLIVGADTREETDVIMRITEESYWKLELFKMAPHSLNWMVKFLDLCQSEDLGLVLRRCGKHWQQKLVSSDPLMEVWKAECIAESNLEWKGQLVLKCNWELQARSVIKVRNLWVGEALIKVPRDQEWKLDIILSLMGEWQVESVLREDRENVANLMSKMDNKNRLNSLKSCSNLDDEWKIKILSGDMDDWKFNMLVSVDEEEKAHLIGITGSQVICKMLLQAEDSWKINAICEASIGGFWLSDLVSRVSEEWQARLVLIGHREKLEKWKLDQIPEITNENMASNYLFSTRCNFPRWKFEIGLQIAQCSDPLAQQKAEFLYRDSSPRWMVEMAARCTEEWRLVNLHKVPSRAVGELYMAAEEEWRGSMLTGITDLWKAEMVAVVPEEWKVLLMFEHARREEKWRLKLVQPLTSEWQVKMVFIAPQTWKAEMIAKLGPDQEMRGRELLDCSTKEFAMEVMGGLLDIYYT